MGARPYRAVGRWRTVAPLLLGALLITLRVWWSAADPGSAPVVALLTEGEYSVARAVDGDTLELDNGVRVRLFGVDTPETVAPNQPIESWGLEASQFAQAFVAAGPVRLSFDQERLDRYGRHLAYVWRGGTLLNEELIRAGLTEAITVFPYSRSMKDRFQAAQREAKKNKRGIWSAK